MKKFELIEKTAKQEFGSFRRFCLETGQDESNFKRKILANLSKMDEWLLSIGLEIVIKRKKGKS